MANTNKGYQGRGGEEGAAPQTDSKLDSAALLRQVHREASNLDIEFADIGEARDALEEASPLPSGFVASSQHNNSLQVMNKTASSSMHGGGGSRLVNSPIAAASNTVVNSSSQSAAAVEEQWPDMVDGERCIRGIPIRKLIDQVKR